MTENPGTGADPVFSPELAPQTDDGGLAQSEAVQLAAGNDLESRAKTKEHVRHQAFRDHVNTALIVIFWTIAACMVMGILAFAHHLLTPATWHFLSKEQLDQIKTLLTSALLSSALTGYAKLRMS